MPQRDARKMSSNELEKVRCEAVILRQEGKTNIEIARVLGVSRNTVSGWIKQWQENGARGLIPKKSGRKVGSGLKLEEAAQFKILQCIKGGSPQDFDLSYELWSRAAIRELAWELDGHDVSMRTMTEYLRKWGFTIKRPLTYLRNSSSAKVLLWLKEEYPKIEYLAKQECKEIHWLGEIVVPFTGDLAKQLYNDDTKVGPYLIRLMYAISKKGEKRFLSQGNSQRGSDLLQMILGLEREVTKSLLLLVPQSSALSLVANRRSMNYYSGHVTVIYYPD